MPSAAEIAFAVKATNETQSAISGVSSDLQKLEGSASSSHGALSSVASDLDGAGAAADESGGKISGLMGNVGGLVAMAGGVAAVGGAFAFAKSAIGDVDSLAESVERLSAATGETPEKASELEFAFSQMGVSGDQAQMMLDKFSKGLNGLIENEDGTTTKSSALTDQLKAIGIATTDASGATLPMSDILGQVADKFANMPDGAQKTALAMQLFGKSGVDLIPFLDKGSAGLQDLMKQSDLLGMTLSGSTLDSVHKNEQAQREFGAALEGVKIQLGTALLPVMTQVMSGAVQLAMAFDTNVLPAIKQAAQWIGTQLAPTFLQIQAALPGIVAAVVSFAEALGTRLLPIIQSVAQWLEQHRQVAMALGIAIAALVAGPIALLIGAAVLIVQHWQELTGAFNATLPVLTAIGNAFSNLFSSILAEAQPLIAWVQGTFLPEFQQDISAVSDFFQQKLLPAIQSVVDFIRDHWSEIEALFKGPLEIVQAIVEGTLNSIKILVEGALRVLGDIITAAMDLIHGDWQGAWKALGDIPVAIWDTIKSLAQNALNELEGILRGAWDSLKADAQLGWDALKAVLADAWTAIKQGVSDGIAGIGQLLSALPGQIVSWLGDVGSLLLDAGEKLITGFVNGIKNQIGSVKDTLGGLAKDVVSWKGPPDYDLTLLVPAGQNTIQGFLNGIQSKIPQVNQVLSGITQAVAATGSGTPVNVYAGAGTALPGGGFSGGETLVSSSAAGGSLVHAAAAAHSSGAGTAAGSGASIPSAGGSGNTDTLLQKIADSTYAADLQLIPIVGQVQRDGTSSNKYLSQMVTLMTQMVQLLAVGNASGSDIARDLDLYFKRIGGGGFVGTGVAS